MDQPVLAYTNVPLKALKQSEKAEHDVSLILPKFSRWVPLICTPLRLTP